jgi:hypothetical protein
MKNLSPYFTWFFIIQYSLIMFGKMTKGSYFMTDKHGLFLCFVSEHLYTQYTAGVSFTRRESLWTHGRPGDWIPAGKRYSTSAQTDPGAHPASYTMGTGSFSVVNRPERGVDHPPPYRAKVKEKVELYLYSTSGPSWAVTGWNLSLLWRNIVARSPNVYTYSAVVLVFMAN